MAKIEDVLNNSPINLTMTAKCKDEVIRQMAQMLYDSGSVSDLEAFIQDVYAREREGITGMGNNVAIPHGKSASVRQAGIAIGRTNEMIEWESYDEKPVKLFFLFAVPSDKEGAEMHLRLLSQLAGKLAHEELLEQLKDAVDVASFKSILG